MVLTVSLYYIQEELKTKQKSRIEGGQFSFSLLKYYVLFSINNYFNRIKFSGPSECFFSIASVFYFHYSYLLILDFKTSYQNFNSQTYSQSPCVQHTHETVSFLHSNQISFVKWSYEIISDLQTDFKFNIFTAYLIIILELKPIVILGGSHEFPNIKS